MICGNESCHSENNVSDSTDQPSHQGVWSTSTEETIVDRSKIPLTLAGRVPTTVPNYSTIPKSSISIFFGVGGVGTSWCCGVQVLECKFGIGLMVASGSNCKRHTKVPLSIIENRATSNQSCTGFAFVQDLK
ncbi:hypothetical protein M3J09_012983 [Ascochyta lentis]